MDQIAAIADAVLYEGYLLWPYRRSALKNRQRWTFGGVYPATWVSRRNENDRARVETACLLEADPDARVDVTVRFLHVVARDVERRDGEPRRVDALEVDGMRHESWDEATERQVGAAGVRVGDLSTSRRVPIRVPAGREEERLPGETPVALVRSWRALAGEIEIDAVAVGEHLFRVRVSVANTTAIGDVAREEAQRAAFLSAHVILHAPGGAFVSAIDPPDTLRDHAAACRQVGLWPVLVGEAGDRRTMLAASIILEDWPRIAPESPGDLFDATEIDQMLVLNVLAMTAEEQDEMRAADPRARAILDRCTSLDRDQLMRLHGAIRSLRPVPGRPA